MTAAGDSEFAKLIARLLNQQKQINTVLGSEFAELMPFLIKNPQTNFAGWLAQAILLVRQYGVAAAALGAGGYTAYRKLFIPAASPFTPPVVDQPPVEQVAEGLKWATRAVTDNADSATLDAGLKQAQGVAQRLVTNTQRKAVVKSVDEDSQAVGWYRVPSDPQACTFCRLMSIRGAVYKSQDTAGRNANEKFVGEGEFKFHDHCECTAAPLFKRTQKLDQPFYVKSWDKEYTAATAHNPSDKLNAYRRVVEERD